MALVNKRENPWKGLQSYQDSDPIYGRDQEIEALYTSITYNTQTVVYGKSGIGKTSILNAGIIHRAMVNDFMPVTVRLDHYANSELNKSESYVTQIEKSLYAAAKAQKVEMEEIVSHDDTHEETLWELFHRFRYVRGEADKKISIRPIVIFDQFEEIFTLQQDMQLVKNFFKELADLLNDVKPDYLTEKTTSSSKLPSKGGNVFSNIANRKRENKPEYLSHSEYHLVIVLREDFLSYLERYTAFIPVMKTNRFPIMPLSIEQAVDVIMLPRPGLVSRDVAELILQKVTGNNEIRIGGLTQVLVDSAILSLYLSRLYDKMDDGATEITKNLVNQFSTHIIVDFYEESVKDIEPEVIQAIEDSLLTSDGRRNNVARLDLVKQGVPDSVIGNLIDDKKLLRQFTYAGVLRVEYMHDILCPVVRERITSREREAERRLQEEEKRRTAEEQRQKLEKEKEKTRLLQRRNKRLVYGGIASFAILMILGIVLWDGFYRDLSVSYGNVVKKNGWYEGINPLSSSEKEYLPYHYILKYKGRWSKRPYAMEARNGYDKLTTEHGIVTYLVDPNDTTDSGVDKNMRQKMQTVCKWEFVTNKDGDFVVQEKWLNAENVLVFVYNQSKIDNAEDVIGTYSDDFGFPMLLRDSIYFYIRSSYDEHGNEILSEFFDDEGMPMTNKDGAYQIKRLFLANGTNQACFSAFLDGNRMNDRSGNCGFIHSKFNPDSTRFTETIFVDSDMRPIVSTKDSVEVVRYEYDEHERIKSKSFWNCSILKNIGEELVDVGYFDNPDTIVYSKTTNSSGVHQVCFDYNQHGQVISETYLNKNGELCNKHDKQGKDFKEIIYKYDEWGNQIEYVEVGKDRHWGTTNMFDNESILIANDKWEVNLKPETLADTIYTGRYFNDVHNRKEHFLTTDLYVLVEKDSRGNILSTKYFASDKKTPIEHNGFQSSIVDYEYNGSITKLTETLYDKSNKQTNGTDGWSKRIVVVDSLSKTKSYLFYDDKGRYFEGYRNRFADNYFTYNITQESINDEWKTIRKYDNGRFYYKLHLIHPLKPSIADKVVGWYALSEFDKPSLITDANGVYYTCYFPYGHPHYYDENRIAIDDPLKYKSFMMAYVEVKQRDGQMQFKDADIILSCNDWEYFPGAEDPFVNTRWWDPVRREFLVARLDERDKKFKLREIVVPADIDIDKYLNFVKFNASYYEAKTIIESVQNNL